MDEENNWSSPRTLGLFGLAAAGGAASGFGGLGRMMGGMGGGGGALSGFMNFAPPFSTAQTPYIGGQQSYMNSLMSNPLIRMG